MKQTLLHQKPIRSFSTLLRKPVIALLQALILCLIFASQPAKAQLTKVWETPPFKHSSGLGKGFVEQEVDEAGNLIILSSDLTLYKYDATGKQLWTAKYEPEESYKPTNAGLWLDRSDNSYVLWGNLLLKYSPTGNLLWNKSFSNSSGAVNVASLTLDVTGNIYLTGALNEGSTQKYSSTGELLWTATTSGETIAVDNKGSVFVATSSSNLTIGNESIIFLKYSAATGAEQMQQVFNTPRVPSYDETAKKIMITNAGEIYILVNKEGGYNGSEKQVFFYKLAANGTLIYKKGIGKTDEEVLFDAVFAANEDIIVLGRLLKYRITWDHFMTRVNSNADHVWYHTFNVYEANNMVRYFAPGQDGMSVKADGSIAIAGSYAFLRVTQISMPEVYTEYPKLILATFSKDGKETWRQVMDHNTSREGSAGVSFIDDKSLYFSGAITTLPSFNTPVNLVAMRYQDCTGFTASAGADKQICAGGSAQLQATGGTTYSWAPATGLSATNVANPTASPTTTTTYTVTVTNAEGCSATDQVTVEVIAAPAVSITPAGATTFCEGGSVVLNATQGADYDYKWFKDGNLINNATGNSFTTFTAGEFKVRVKRGNCETISAPVTVVVNKPAVVNAGTAQTVCAGSAALLLTGFSPAGGNWSGPGVSANGLFNPATAGTGTHTLTYTITQNNCEGRATKTITVTPGVATPGAITGNTTICAGSTNLTYSINAVAKAENYTWTVPEGFTITEGQGSTSIKVTAGSDGGNITVKANNNCGSSEAASIAVNITAQPTSKITVQGNTTFCEGGSVILIAPAGANYTYQWLLNGTAISGATGADYSAKTSGNYTVQVKNGSCTITSDHVAVTVISGVRNNTIATGNQTICAGASAATLQGSTPTGGSTNYTYQWEQSTDGTTFSSIPEATAQNFTPANLTATTWFRRKVMSGNCSSTSSTVKVTIQAPPTVSLSAFGNMCTDDNALILTGGQPAGGTYTGTGVTNGNFNAGMAGAGTHTITYTFTDASGCSATATQTIVVEEACEVTGVEEDEPPHKFDFFPNPAKDKLNIEVELPDKTDVTIEIADVRGRIILQKDYKGQIGAFSETILLVKKARGMYFLRFTTKDGTYNRKVLLW